MTHRFHTWGFVLRLSCLLGLLPLQAGCLEVPDPLEGVDPTFEADASVGLENKIAFGQVHTGHFAVGSVGGVPYTSRCSEDMHYLRGSCTGTLVGANAALTARHCLPPEINEHVNLALCNGSELIVRNAHALHHHPHADVSVIVWEEPITEVEPIPINLAPLTLEGGGGRRSHPWVTILGIGNDEFSKGFVKRIGVTQILELREPRWYLLRGLPLTPLDPEHVHPRGGDSGGPGLMTNTQGREVLVGVHNGGTAVKAQTRTDALRDWFEEIQGSMQADLSLSEVPLTRDRASRGGSRGIDRR